MGMNYFQGLREQEAFIWVQKRFVAVFLSLKTFKKQKRFGKIVLGASLALQIPQRENKTIFLLKILNKQSSF